MKSNSWQDLVATATLDTQTSRPNISIIIPVYNEEENLENLQARISEILEEIKIDYEIIYVDDGSRDNSFMLLEKLAKKDSRIKLIKFRKNHGQTAAMSAAIDVAQGEIIIPLDADLQNDPRDIPNLLDKIAEGYDVVSGWRRARQDTFITRKLPSMMANRLISSVTGVYLHDYGCSLKAYRADIVKNVRLYGEMHRFIPAFCALEGARVTEIPVNHHPRVAGKSKYGLSRIVKVFLDLMVVKFLGDYAKRPIHVFGTIGLILCFGASLAGVATLYDKFIHEVYVHRNPLILLAVFLFLVGVQFIMVGLIAELIIRTYHESQGKKTYTIAKTVNLPSNSNP
ncbi:MAG: glycosyltransferase family 2 protein [Acidobacteria bacterium]|nr:glycosyltransferase family 2 protein [Acidobacteriota bacterium]